MQVEVIGASILDKSHGKHQQARQSCSHKTIIMEGVCKPIRVRQEESNECGNTTEALQATNSLLSIPTARRPVNEKEKKKGMT